MQRWSAELAWVFITFTWDTHSQRRRNCVDGVTEGEDVYDPALPAALQSTEAQRGADQSLVALGL